MTTITDLRQQEGETWQQYDERINIPWRLQRRERMERADWVPTYSYWRHGGSYVDNVVFPSGATGCIASAAHTISGKFESACFNLGMFKTRTEAAFAERAEAMRHWAAWDAERAMVNA